MNRKVIIMNCVAIGLCVLLLAGNLYDVIAYGAYDSIGRSSSNAIYLSVKVVMFSIGLILMNIQIRGAKLKLAIALLIIFICSGFIVGNLAYDQYNQVTSDSDWFGDGID